MSKISKPKVINLRRVARAMTEGTVRVDRRTKWGNPFVVGKDGTCEEVIAKYRTYLQQQIADGVLDPTILRGKNLACWCAPNPCHADVLLEFANE